MNKQKILLLMVGAALAAPTASAQVFQYAQRDLVLSFHRSGFSDLEVNIGSVDNLKALAPGMTLSIGGYDANSQLMANFGNLNSLTYSVIGAQKTAGASPQNTVWLTSKRTDQSTTSSTPIRYTASKSQSIQSQVSGIIGDGSVTGAKVYSSSVPADPFGNTPTAVVIPTSSGLPGNPAANSYTIKYGATGGLASLINSPGIENTTPDNFSAISGGMLHADLFQYAPGSAGSPAENIGYFSLANDGNMTFTAVPEPGTVTTFILGGLACLGLRRKKNSKNKL